MASDSTRKTPEVTFFYKKLRPFPSIINGRLSAVKFLEAASDLVTLVERLGKTFAPVKYDLQGNIDKVKKHYEYDNTSCLLELMVNEINNGKHTAAEGILWLNRLKQEILKKKLNAALLAINKMNNLNKTGQVRVGLAHEGFRTNIWQNNLLLRALFFFELLFQEIIINLKSNIYNTSISTMYIVAYEGSLKKYHNWVTQQLFALICKMSPTLPQLMKALDLNDDDVTIFESLLTNFNVTLHLVRCKIDDFFADHNVFEEKI